MLMIRPFDFCFRPAARCRRQRWQRWPHPARLPLQCGRTYSEIRTNHATQRYSLWNRNEIHRAGRWQWQWQLTPSTDNGNTRLSLSLPLHHADKQEYFSYQSRNEWRRQQKTMATNDNNGDLLEVRQFFHDSFPIVSLLSPLIFSIILVPVWQGTKRTRRMLE